MPAPVVRQVLRGMGMTVGANVATVAADLAALLAGVRVETWGPWFGLLVGLLTLTGAHLRRRGVSGQSVRNDRSVPATPGGETGRQQPPAGRGVAVLPAEPAPASVGVLVRRGGDLRCYMLSVASFRRRRAT
jgi:hypothetical protein